MGTFLSSVCSLKMTECPSIQQRLSNPVEDQKEIKIRMTVLCSDLGNEQQWIYPDSHNGFFFSLSNQHLALSILCVLILGLI